MNPARIRRTRGFTLIEIVVVMAIIGLLLTLAVPRYMHSIERGKEQVRQQNIAVMRNAIDQYYGDNGQYPETIDELVSKHYLRAVPFDPVNGDDKWAAIASSDETKPGVYDVAPASSAQAAQPAAMSVPK
ncbi:MULTISPECIES: prepilin-type N-terminal cleavage/methylation domain-containing protein [unclassified Burkholderia]|uniref:type II secretion system protein n=1 Tax=unclassified Burkholderia TaxID=2613784 RepID=UPI00141FCE7C|nr:MULTISPECIES: prepilin-type N-terminal cleavage/methylation domain-containing protein [unclassified Burkholderia]NIE58259.1 prepilin-type N-terminal cleavage/methylation domain-containing protein [Burkholderia sp. Ap-955]NIF14574.1 prepilin-type N-terminal cleavage/methylation domain-containing protein [Burkholderia sp. Ax-1735]NIG07741.1 prepilin-type N-terminal cleavage/methylation domain-containing protein [Burkholderia sp. Tr-849]